MWVYIKSEERLWTVGFYTSDGKWHAITDFGNEMDAQRRVHYLNGGSD